MQVYSFYAELQARLAGTERPYEQVFRRFMQCFSFIPLAARVGQRALAMHGGLSPKLEALADIAAIPRPVHFANGTLACDLVWSDPHRGTDEYEVSGAAGDGESFYPPSARR